MLPEIIRIEIARYLSYGWRWQIISDLVRYRHDFKCSAEHLRWLYEESKKIEKPLLVLQHQERFIKKGDTLDTASPFYYTI